MKKKKDKISVILGRTPPILLLKSRNAKFYWLHLSRRAINTRVRVCRNLASKSSLTFGYHHRSITGAMSSWLPSHAKITGKQARIAIVDTAKSFGATSVFGRLRASGCVLRVHGFP